MPPVDDKETRDKLLNDVKKEVKQLMELSATCKFIHENNHTFTNFCNSIDCCLLHGLKKDFLNKPSSYDLVKKISKECKSAGEIVKIFNELESNINNNQNYTKQIDSNTNKETAGLFSKIFSLNSSKNNINPETINHFIPLYLSNSSNLKNLWIKIAILRKCLIEIIDFVIKNWNRFYHSNALVANSFESALLVSLIAGPCAFDKYTRFKTIENADPDADELIRRHKLHLNSPNRSPFRTVKTRLRSVNLNHVDNSNRFSVGNIREFVESLHQNVKSQLIYGKNHVIVNQKEKTYAGYLSLHLNPTGFILNWTPNEVLNGSYVEHEETHKSKSLNNINDLIIYIELDTISYLHCHQQNSTCIQVIFVAQDGAQYPPIQFTDTPNLVHFLHSIEIGLKPIFKLSPSDWEMSLNSNKMPLIIKKIFASLNSDLNDLSNYSSLKQENSIHDIHLSPINPDNSIISYSTPETLKQTENMGLKNLCDDIEYKILSRAFYGWLNYHRETKTVNRHLVKLLNFDPSIKNEEPCLVKCDIDELMEKYLKNNQKLDESLWTRLMDTKNFDQRLFYKIVYLNGIQTNELRKQVWPYLLGIYKFEMSQEEIELKNKMTNKNYCKLINEWKPYEEQVRLNDEKKLNFSLSHGTPSKEDDSGICSDLTQTTISSSSDNSIVLHSHTPKKRFFNKVKIKHMQTPMSTENSFIDSNKSKFSFFSFNNSSVNDSRTDLYNLRNEQGNFFDKLKAKLIKHPQNESLLESNEHSSPSIRVSKSLTVDEIYTELAQMLVTNAILKAKHEIESELTPRLCKDLDKTKSIDLLSPIKDEDETQVLLNNISPLSIDSGLSNNTIMDKSNERMLDKDLYDAFALNIHRIDKDVLRCDRNFWYFSSTNNLNKLRNIIYTYVWETIDIGYIQGMCDLIAPILVIFDDEAIVYDCFRKLMDKMRLNFISNTEMDKHFSNMRSLVQILDKELFEHINTRGDHTQFYFTYRWFLLDFKRELVYKDIFTVWETIWASKHYLKSDSFQLFIALAMVEIYRDIILENEMDFTDIIKFFNEMSEKHDIKETLDLARDLVDQLKNLIEEKYR